MNNFTSKKLDILSKTVKDIKDKSNRDKLNLEKIRLIARNNGYELISNIWVDYHSIYEFKNIETGKFRPLSAAKILYGKFPKETKTSEEFYNELLSLSTKRGYKLVTKEWTSGNSICEFIHIESNRKYEWPGKQILHHDFPKDPRTPAYRLEDLAIHSEKNGYTLINKTWLYSHIKHQFRHNETGRTYEWVPDQVLGKAGFPEDPRTPEHRLEDLAIHSEKNGYTLLNKTWLTSKVNHQFFHKESGRTYNWTPDQILGIASFPDDPRTPEHRLEDLAKLASENGCRLLNDIWLGSGKNHSFIHLESNEKFECLPDNIKQRGFPNFDKKYITQEVCRQVFSYIFGGDFKTNKIRLKELHGKNLELDGYQEFESIPKALLRSINNFEPNYSNIDGKKIGYDIHIAFEFQGHPNHQKDKKTILLDEIKRKLCEQDGIFFIQIDPPNWDNIRDSKYMFDFVCDQIKNNANNVYIDFPCSSEFEIDLNYRSYESIKYDELANKSTINGYKLIEKKWMGIDYKHKFLHIDSNREYEWSAYQILSRGFPKNPRTPIYKHEDLAKIANEYGCILNEKEWLGYHTYHQFTHIESGDVFPRKPSKIYEKAMDGVNIRGFPKKYSSQEDKAVHERFRS